MSAPSKTEDPRSASAAALRSARDKLAAGFESQFGGSDSSPQGQLPALSRPSSTTLARRSCKRKMPVVLAQQRLNHNQVDLGSDVDATTDDSPDSRGSLAPPASRRPPSSGSSGGPSQLSDQRKTPRGRARNWLQGAMSMATSPLVPRPAADLNGPSEKRRIAITAREHAAILREHDSKVKETKQNSEAKIKRSIVFLSHEQGYHV